MIYGGHFDPIEKQKKIDLLEKEMLNPNFWDNKQNSEKTISELNYLKDSLNNVEKLLNETKSNLEIIELLQTEDDSETHELIEAGIETIKENIAQEKVKIYLDGPYDNENAIIEIKPGAGGTESCDWANMLYRMYLRYMDKKNYKYEVIEEQAGDEAGIKDVTILVRGPHAFGYLNAERGVHRLVRISPFDSNSRRHTSFASVGVSPLFEDNNINIEINESDIRIDVYRSSGCGGQGVNTTDSAVRITHFPSKIVVTCQNERSQIQNKEKAMQVLKNKLYKLELEKKENELKSLKGEMTDINFGSQIRSYVMHPYSMVKDHRTNYETANVAKVLDGDLDNFINSYLMKGRK